MHVVNQYTQAHGESGVHGVNQQGQTNVHE